MPVPASAILPTNTAPPDITSPNGALLGTPARCRRARCRRLRRRLGSDERGSATVEFVICVAGMVMLLLLVVQAAVAFHGRAVAHTAARHGLDHVRTLDGSTAAGVSAASSFLAQAGGGLRDSDVTASRGADTSSVSVSATVISVLPGVNLTINVTVDAPTERIVA